MRKKNIQKDLQEKDRVAKEEEWFNGGLALQHSACFLLGRKKRSQTAISKKKYEGSSFLFLHPFFNQSPTRTGANKALNVGKEVVR